MIRSTLLLALVCSASLGAQPPARPRAETLPPLPTKPRVGKPGPTPEAAPKWPAPSHWELMPKPGHEPPLWHETPMTPMEPMQPMTPMAPMKPMAPVGPKAFGHEPPSAWHTAPDWIPDSPPRAWAPEDPADSLYRRARELLNRGEYRQAAFAFRDLSQKFATSQYAPSALYWQAFALYRIGGMSELREALGALEAHRAKYPSAKNENDVITLSTRILGALAARGDASAQRQVAQTAQQGERCENDEDQAVRVEALKALYQSDPETVAPLIQQVLARRDECSVQLRRNAIFLIGNRRDQGATAVLANVARSDPSLDVRVEAISWLGRLGDDAALEVLEEVLRSSNDERAQRAAIRALANHPNQRALQRLRALVERTDAPERLRADAITTFDRERVTADEVAWLRALYPKLDKTALKQRAVGVIAKAGGPENDAWLQSILRNEDESSEVRSAVLSKLGQTMSIADLGKMYDGAASRMVREYIISALARRSEAEATDKLLDIVKNGTDPALQRAAISALTRKKDPRSTKLLLELIAK